MMKTKLHLVLSFTIFTSFFYVSAQDGYWQQASNPGEKMATHVQRFDTEKVQFYALDKHGLQTVLNDLNTQKKTSATVYFPDEKGELVPFLIKEAPVMAPELTAKYPDIRSYKGRSLKNNKDRIRVSVSRNGVQTMIVHTDKKWNTYMEKATEEETYVVYQKNADLTAKGDFICYTREAIQQKEISSVAKLADDQILRTYRIAVSATGEYTQFHGGSVLDAMGAINATLTRVNEIFETDLAITLELVANNDAVIFANPDTDPYDSNLNTEVQNTLATIIGEANYDVGHLFHEAPDAGNAGFIGSVCQDGQKGSAFSAALNPQGDIFDVDFVTHELGHQFGANHTWSFETEGTGVQAEPASGSTIMGYAGIVPGNNVEPNGDDYYHYYSIIQIAEYLDVQSCAQEMPLTNSPPVIIPGDDYVIPRSTAFFLEGDATDPDVGDVLTYAWEQIDNGVVTTTSFGPDNPNGANFRSLPPSSSPRRYFPRLSEVALGNLTQINPAESSAWETVSDIEREMNFALTVRDNASGGGQVSSDLVKIDVFAGAGPFQVNSQSAPETVTAGTALTVLWDVADTDRNPINAQFVDVLLSTDGGQTFPNELSMNTPNDGSHEVLIPGLATTQARIMVRASDNVFFAVNSADFTVEESEFVLQFDELDYEVCQPDDLIIPFTYETFSGFSEEATFSAIGTPAGLSTVFSPAMATADDTPVNITFSGTDAVTPGIYPITIRATTASLTKDILINIGILRDTFTEVVLLNPADSQTDVSLNDELIWEASDVATSYEIEIATDMAFSNVIENATVIFTSYKPTLLEQATPYFWRVKPVNSCAEGIFSPPFSFTTVSINCKTVAATGLPIAISSSGTPTITSTISLIDDLPIADVNVSLNIDHTFVSDLVISLQSPAGTTVTLVANACGDFMDIDAVFDDEGSGLVCGNNPAISGTIRPLGSLASFNGESSVGDWILTVDDVANADGGALNTFDLEICVEGEFKPDTDGDGVFDEDDLCPGTPPGSEVDTDGCEVFRFATDNFTISAESEACIGSSDGQIVISAQTIMDYTVTVSGPATDVNDSFTNTYTLANISGGTYTVCIGGTSGNMVFEELCFELVIEEPAPLAVSSVLAGDGQQVSLSLSGAELYNIELNGNLIQTADSELTLDLQKGINSLKITTLQPCQGSIEEEFILGSEPVVFPNPFADIAFVNLLTNTGDAEITVHSSDGRLVMQKGVEQGNVELALDFSGLPSGLYFVRVEKRQMKKTYKLIKR